MDDTNLKAISKKLEASTRCNCDLNNWQPERDTGHSWVCRIHKAAKDELKRKVLKVEGNG